MKVGIITFHFVNNYGGVLQAYALQQVISERFGAECRMIDYRNWFIRLSDTLRLFPITTNGQELVSGLRTMGKRFGRVKKFRKFMDVRFHLTDYYSSSRQLKKAPPVCDRFICGSDQIWNPTLTMGIAPAYFLAFESDPARKIAYAPSFGSDGVASRYERGIKKNLSSVGHLSVREGTGQDLVRKLTGREASLLIDPTFLPERAVWEKAGPWIRRKSDYILLYIMQRDPEVYEHAKTLKKELGLRIVEISRYGYNPGFVDETLVNVGPNDFVGLFRDAAFVCTNSYHGLAYSIIFEKEFLLIPCKHFTARIKYLLELLQIADDGEIGKPLRSAYDKAAVRELIAKEREKAFAYLEEALGQPAEDEKTDD